MDSSSLVRAWSSTGCRTRVAAASWRRRAKSSISGASGSSLLIVALPVEADPTAPPAQASSSAKASQRTYKEVCDVDTGCAHEQTCSRRHRRDRRFRGVDRGPARPRAPADAAPPGGGVRRGPRAADPPPAPPPRRRGFLRGPRAPPPRRSRLPEILERVGWLPVRHATDGEPIEPGNILIAPPDRHMTLHPDRVELNREPRVNSTRPAIDPLFRTAALAFGPRVCGVILSGHLDDGAEGLRAIVDAGGMAMVQDPREAAHPDMPHNALRAATAAQVHTAMRLGLRIAELAQELRPS